MKWAVVGGGVLGMSLARDLRSMRHEVTLFDAADHLGGLAAPWQLGDVTWDRHYHVTLLSDQRTREMYRSVGITDDSLHWVLTRTGYYGADGTLRSVSGIAEFLRLPGISLLGKLRLGATILYGSRIRDGARMERIGVERWLRRWSGSTAFEVFWRPMLRAKLGDAYPRASAAFIWATMRRLSAARRSGINEERFGYPSGGYAAVCARFETTLASAGVDLRLGQPVLAVRRAAEGLVVETSTGAESFDRVVVTTGAPLAAQLCPDLLPRERKRLENVEYVGIVCVSLLLRRALGGYYLTYITDPQTPFTAVVEMTALIDPAEVDGHTLVYLPKYTAADDPLFGTSDDEVVAEFLPYLRQMYPGLDDDDVVVSRVSRVRQVFAVPTRRYSESMPSIATSVPGLYLAGSANLPFATLNVNDTLSLLERVHVEARTAMAPGPDEVATR